MKFYFIKLVLTCLLSLQRKHGTDVEYQRWASGLACYVAVYGTAVVPLVPACDALGIGWQLQHTFTISICERLSQGSHSVDLVDCIVAANCNPLHSSWVGVLLLTTLPVGMCCTLFRLLTSPGNAIGLRLQPQCLAFKHKLLMSDRSITKGRACTAVQFARPAKPWFSSAESAL